MTSWQTDSTILHRMTLVGLATRTKRRQCLPRSPMHVLSTMKGIGGRTASTLYQSRVFSRGSLAQTIRRL
eukprot:184569-Lingulodinium_polyedra.AAC.1